MSEVATGNAAAKSASRTSWSSAAFIVESMILLLILVGSLAVLTQVFSLSLNRSVESRSLDAASIAASSIAEHFASDPTGVEESTQLGDLYVICKVQDEKRTRGTLYKADISVYDMGTGEVIYGLSTSRYVSEVSP